MKREQSPDQPTTTALAADSHLHATAADNNRNRKRLKSIAATTTDSNSNHTTTPTTAKVNGYIVYSRVRKKSGDRNKESENCFSNGKIRIPEEANHCVKKENGEVDVVSGDSLVKREVVEPTRKREERKPRRFTRLSTLNNKVETEEAWPVVDVKVNGLDIIDRETVAKVDVETIAEGSALTDMDVSLPSKKNLELKMSKKIVLDSVPMTVKELFETGLLEGVPVVYMGGKKFEAFTLRGIIKDVGILCSCISCNWQRVLPPSQFEIHAIRQYRRASQYICFENGKSLLDVLDACRYCPLDSLEATIHKEITSSPQVKTFMCKRCKGIFPSNFVGRVGPLCNSCAPAKETRSSPMSDSSTVVSPGEPAFGAEWHKSCSLAGFSQDNTPENIARKSSKRGSNKKTPTSAPSRVSSRIKNKEKITPNQSRLMELDSEWKPSRSSSVHLCSAQNEKQKITHRKSKSVSISKFFESTSSTTSSNKNQRKITIKEQRLHKLVFEQGALLEGSEVAYFARGQKLLVGYKRGFGILCRCCNCVVSPSTFEAHAGWATRKKPFAYIYTSNGVSLHELAISLSKGCKYSARENDDLCRVCGKGGDILLCSGCPRAFHEGCASLSSLPSGDWYCQFCQNMFQKEKFMEHNSNGVAAPLEQITKRCIRIVKNLDAELSGCVLCRCYDFSRSGFGPRTRILCDQCEKEFHVGCLRSHRITNLKELPKGKWFCCKDCGKIHSALQEFLFRGAEKLPDSFLKVLSKKYMANGVEENNNLDVRWRLLSGKIETPEARSIIAQALSVFQECFDPIIDTMSGHDLIPLMVYGKNSKEQDYGGMYLAVLTVNSLVVSVGIIRVFGQEVAELPLVATSNHNHGKGYFQMLFSCIEQLLAVLNIQSVVLPAGEGAQSIWTDKFGFQKIKPEQLDDYRKRCCQMLMFEGTSVLQKAILPIVNK